MSVLVDGRELSGEGTWSGVGTTIRGLLGGLSEAPGLSISALTTPAVPLPGGIDRATIHRLSTSGRRRSVMEHQLALPLDLARHRTDVFHNPHPHPPVRVGRPWVQTLYDVIPLVVDDPNMDGLRRRWERFAPRYRRADLVVAISRHAANEGIRHLGLDHRRVEVVHLGVDASFHPAERAEADDEVPSVLVVSEYSRRKGYADAFAVIAALADAGFPHRLRVAGRIPPRLAPELEQLRHRSGRPDRIDLLGYVPDVAALYRAADLVLVPSRYEGFGLPAAEAMASGVPVVTYDNSSLPEVVGPGGLVVPDGDVAAMIAASRAVLGDAEVAADQRERGLARATAFSWSAAAASYAEIYRQVGAR